MSGIIQARVEELKTKSDEMLRELEKDINPYIPMSEKQILDNLEKSRNNGQYRKAEDVVLDMRAKYGL